jgi:hypothetical protein
MEPITWDQEDELPPREGEGVQGVLGELEERPPPRRLPQAPRDEANLKHTGQIARDVYRD